MINLELETLKIKREMIELTKVQLQDSINKFLDKEEGLTSILEMTLNGLMLSERSNYLSESIDNKGNGYRKAFAVGLGKQIELNPHYSSFE